MCGKREDAPAEGLEQLCKGRFRVGVSRPAGKDGISNQPAIAAELQADAAWRVTRQVADSGLTFADAKDIPVAQMLVWSDWQHCGVRAVHTYRGSGGFFELRQGSTVVRMAVGAHNGAETGSGQGA